MKANWLDSPGKYGLVSRLLHWGMAAIFAWQFLGMIFKVTLGKTPLTGFFTSSHASLGALLFLLVALRLVWALYNARRRPGYEASCSGLMARLGHVALYGLMFAVPSLALLRSYGSGRAFAPFGIPLWSAGEDRVEWMTAAGNAAHGLLGWVLLAIIVGHLGMAIWHRVAKRDDVWQRMA